MENTRGSTGPVPAPGDVPPPAASSESRALGLWGVLGLCLYSLIGGVVLLLLVEVALRAFWPQTPEMTVVDQASGTPVTWAVPDEVLGHRLRPNTVATERAPEFSVQYYTGPDGFRESPPPTGAEAQEAGGSRIMVLGDSFAFGYGSEWDDAWATRMEHALDGSGYPAEVINTGTPGYDTRSEVLLLERVIGQYRPSVVLINFLTNDLFTNLPVARSETSKQVVERRVQEIGGGKQSELHSVVLLKRALMSLDRLYCQLYLGTQRREYFTLPMSRHIQAQLKTTQELLEQASAVASSNGARLVVLSVPQLFQVLHVAHGYDFEGVDSRWIDGEMARHAEENGYVWLPALDFLAEAYRGGATDLYYRFDGHLTPEGNEAVAQFLARHTDLLLARTETSGALIGAGSDADVMKPDVREMF